MVLIFPLKDIKRSLANLEGLNKKNMPSFLIISIVGILACVVLDLWQRFLFLFFKIPPSNWAMVGRWLLLFLKSMLWVQRDLSEQSPVKNELYIGWGFHYAVAILYALLFFFLFKEGVVTLSLRDGVVFGIISVIVPWFFFMPAMGAGIFANKTPNPILACVLALIAHTIFGGTLGAFFNVFYYQT